MSATKFAASLEIPLVRTGRGPTEIRVPIARVHGTPSPPVFLADQREYHLSADAACRLQAGEGGGLLSSVNLFEVIPGGIDAGLGAGLILIAGGSADADRADLHFARGHNR